MKQENFKTNDGQPYELKYQPKTVDDLILDDETFKTIKSLTTDNNNFRIIFAGTAGVGKTTAAKCIVNDIGGDLLMVNASLNRGIETIRSQVSDFVTTKSIQGRRKVVILDEGDSLSSDAQMSLRSLISESKHCSFIITCNYPEKIIPPISQSRFYTLTIKSPKDKEVFSKIASRLSKILRAEGVEFEKEDIVKLIKHGSNDYRKLLNALQYNTVDGHFKFNTPLPDKAGDVDRLRDIIQNMRYTEALNYVNEQDGAITIKNLVNIVWGGLDSILAKDNVPLALPIIHRYQMEELAPIAKVQMLAFLVELMLLGE